LHAHPAPRCCGTSVNAPALTVPVARRADGAFAANPARHSPAYARSCCSTPDSRFSPPTFLTSPFTYHLLPAPHLFAMCGLRLRHFLTSPGRTVRPRAICLPNSTHSSTVPTRLHLPRLWIPPTPPATRLPVPTLPANNARTRLQAHANSAISGYQRNQAWRRARFAVVSLRYCTRHFSRRWHIVGYEHALVATTAPCGLRVPYGLGVHRGQTNPPLNSSSHLQ